MKVPLQSICNFQGGVLQNSVVDMSTAPMAIIIQFYTNSMTCVGKIYIIEADRIMCYACRIAVHLSEHQFRTLKYSELLAPDIKDSYQYETRL